MTYGEVALEAGYPGAARAVGHLLATSDGALPWWRVVTAVRAPGAGPRARARPAAALRGRGPAPRRARRGHGPALSRFATYRGVEI